MDRVPLDLPDQLAPKEHLEFKDRREIEEYRVQQETLVHLVNLVTQEFQEHPAQMENK